MSFLVLHNMSNFILKVVLCLLDWKKLAPEIQGLSSTYYNFQVLWRPWIFILKFKNVQAACEPCRGCYIQESCIIRVFFCCCLQVDEPITRRAYKRPFRVTLKIDNLSNVTFFLGSSTYFYTISDFYSKSTGKTQMLPLAIHKSWPGRKYKSRFLFSTLEDLTWLNLGG